MATIGSTNISFSELRNKWKVVNFNEDTDPSDTGDTLLNISLSEFRGALFTSGVPVPDGVDDEISIHDHFKGRTFDTTTSLDGTYTTDGFRAFNTWSSYPTKLKGETADSIYSGNGNTANRNVKLYNNNQGEAYSTILLVGGSQTESSSNKFLVVDRDATDADGRVGEAEVWFRVKNHNGYNQVQFGIIKKDYDISWSTQLASSQMTNNHAAKGDRLAFHGAGYHTYGGSRDDIVSASTIVSPAWTTGTYADAAPVTNQGITTFFHHIIGVTAGTHRTRDADRLDAAGSGKTAEFNKLRHFFKNSPTGQWFSYSGFRSNSLNPNHGLKIKWYEKTLDVYITQNSPYLKIQGDSNWDNGTSSTGLSGIFSGMYITAVSPNSGLPTLATSESISPTPINVYIGEIHTNYMVMYKERRTTTNQVTINATATGNRTITISGYLYWTLVTEHDTTNSNTNYSNPKIIGPPHTVLPRWQVSSAGSSSQDYMTKEWAFYIGDTTSSGSNYFEYHIRDAAPTPAFNYSVTYSPNYPTNNILGNLQNLAVTLNSHTVSHPSTNINTAVSSIHSANSSFNIFAIVGKNDISESLEGQGYNYSNGRPPSMVSKFYYNTNSSSHLGHGGTIENMTGGSSSISRFDLSAIDGKKWMAMAMYSAGSFKGILVWVFTNSVIDSTGYGVGSRTHSTVRSIFYPEPDQYKYSQIHPIVIGSDGAITHYSSNGSTGWIYSNAQGPGENGYKATNKFSQDDGCWGFQIDDQVDGNAPGNYLNSGSSSKPSFGIINPNSNDTQSSHYWNYTGSGVLSNNIYVGFVFSADYSESTASDTILGDLRSLAVTLNNHTVSHPSTNINTAVSSIHAANSCFNIFAIVGKDDISEGLDGQGYNYSNGRPTSMVSKFYYNTNSSNHLGYGGTIENMTGGSDNSLSAIDGKKWMAMAMYSAGSFKGILVWVFTNSVINSSGNTTGTRTHSTVRSIFHPEPDQYKYSQIHPIVIGTNGAITHSSVNGSTGWIYSNAQGPGANGYKATNKFSQDDGCWGFEIGDQVDGNTPGNYLNGGTSSNPSFGIINPNSSDNQSNHYWNYTGSGTQLSNNTYVGFVFSGDYSGGGGDPS